MKYFLGLAIITISLSASAERTLEPIVRISANDALNLLGDEQVLYMSNYAAETLLGVHIETAMTINDINQMPATAAGHERILIISADQAEVLLGNSP